MSSKSEIPENLDDVTSEQSKNKKGTMGFLYSLHGKQNETKYWNNFLEKSIDKDKAENKEELWNSVKNRFKLMSNDRNRSLNNKYFTNIIDKQYLDESEFLKEKLIIFLEKIKNYFGVLLSSENDEKIKEKTKEIIKEKFVKTHKLLEDIKSKRCVNKEKIDFIFDMLKIPKDKNEGSTSNLKDEESKEEKKYRDEPSIDEENEPSIDEENEPSIDDRKENNELKSDKVKENINLQVCINDIKDINNKLYKLEENYKLAKGIVYGIHVVRGILPRIENVFGDETLCEYTKVLDGLQKKVSVTSDDDSSLKTIYELCYKYSRDLKIDKRYRNSLNEALNSVEKIELSENTEVQADIKEFIKNFFNSHDIYHNGLNFKQLFEYTTILNRYLSKLSKETAFYKCIFNADDIIRKAFEKSWISNVKDFYKGGCDILEIENKEELFDEELQKDKIIKFDYIENPFKGEMWSCTRKQGSNNLVDNNFIEIKTIKELINNCLYVFPEYSTRLKKLKNDISLIKLTSYHPMVELENKKVPGSMIMNSDSSTMSADEKFNLIKELYRIDYVDDYEEALKKCLKDIFGSKSPEELTANEQEFIMLVVDFLRETNSSCVKYSYGHDFETIRKVIMELKKYKSDDDYDDYNSEKGYVKYLDNKNGPTCYDFFARLFGILYNKKPKGLDIEENSKKMLDAYLCKVDSSPYTQAIKMNKDTKYNTINEYLEKLRECTIEFSKKTETNNDDAQKFVVCIRKFEDYLEKNKWLEYKDILSKSEEIDKLIESLCPDSKGDLKDLMIEFLKDKTYFDKENNFNNGVLVANKTSV